MEWAIVVVGALVVTVACFADSVRDKRASAKGFAAWHRLYSFPKWVPKFVRRKLQNRWHIWKQVAMYLGVGAFAALVSIVAGYVAGAWIVGVASFAVDVACGVIAWGALKPPEHWN